MLEEDPTIFLSDFGVPVVANGTVGVGILDMPGEYVLDDMQISTDYMLRAEASKFGALAYGQLVLAGNNAYTVRDNRLLDDGVFCLVQMTRIVQSITAVFELDVFEPGVFAS